MNIITSRSRMDMLLGLSVLFLALLFFGIPESISASHGGCGPFTCGVRTNISSGNGGSAPYSTTVRGSAWASSYSGGFHIRLHCKVGPSDKHCRDATSCDVNCSYNPSSTTTYRVRNNSYVKGHDQDNAYKDSSGRTFTVTVAAPPPPPPTWSVTLSASATQGLTPFTPTLTGTGSGTANGGIRWQFDCTNDGIWERDVTNSSNPENWACAYPSPGTYTARVRSIRQGLSRTDTLVITVSDPPVGGIDASASCATGITGWARDEDDTATSLLYEIYLDGDRTTCPGCLVTSGTANLPGNGPGNHSLAWPIPAGPPYRDGLLHAYSLYARDSLLTGPGAWTLLDISNLTCFEPPVVTLTATPDTIAYNTATSMTWTVSNPGGVTCTASGGSASWTGVKTPTGAGVEPTDLLSTTTTFTLSCTNGIDTTVIDEIVTVGAPPLPTVTIDSTNFCGISLVDFTYVGAGSMSAYALQIDDNAGFSSPEFDTSGSVSYSGPNPGSFTPSANLVAGRQYHIQAKAWDALGTEGPWSAGTQFFHPPKVGIMLTPAQPIVDTPFTVTDTTTFGDSAIRNYGVGDDARYWDMGDGTTFGIPTPRGGGSSELHTYTDTDPKTITLTVEDQNNIVCTETLEVNTTDAIPLIKEVLPQ